MCKQKRWNRKLLFPRLEGEQEAGEILDGMVKQVTICCVLVKCQSTGCMEQEWVKELVSGS